MSSVNTRSDRFDVIVVGAGFAGPTRVAAATFDEADARWRVQTEKGETFSAQFCVMATGCLSAPMTPDVPGRKSFAGLTLQTSLWPKEPVDLRGKRVGLIGTGSSGVQTTCALAGEVDHLYVFQRTAVYTFPVQVTKLDPETQRRTKENYEDLRRKQRESQLGLISFGNALVATEVPMRRILDTPMEERLAAVDSLGWAAGRAWADVIAEALSPRGYPMGCKRMVIDTGYFEAFNRENVTLVDLRKGGIERITPTGIRTSQGDFEVDVVIFATGFDAMTGALNRIDIRGRDGSLLRDVWAESPRTCLGLQSVGFPNLFTVTGPGSPSVLTNMVASIEQHVEWIADCVSYVRRNGRRTIEPTAAAQDDWVEHVNAVASPTMFTAPTCNSWYLGANIPGKTRVFMPYVGGLKTYRDRCEAVAVADYGGFVVA